MRKQDLKNNPKYSLAEDLRKSLWRGCTCYHYIEVYDIIDNYVLFHHKSHAEYLGRFSGSTTCASYYCLYPFGYVKEVGCRLVYPESTASLYFSGRMNKERDVCIRDFIDKTRNLRLPF